MTPAPLTLSVNGQEHRVTARADAPLLYILRNDLGLNGPKYGCGQGECGACMVTIDGKAARSCSVPAGAITGRPVVTLEGLAQGDALHAVQQAFIDEQAAQCGYCINGMIMTTVALLARNPRPDDATIRQALAHNLCRCGTHIEILRAVRRAAGRPADGSDEGAPA
ncbi:(2Fe-2S)-binding protein [Achromobacter sp. GG226]|uniref:(2Fe-2S)-binding protein n=1 Tax=Verticiella alkaliphila TaxID=2779529 RepID=UPI001C0AD4FD|nr:(2Fe-2S)-binding protein [Verticiella sp. GG226]MBU4609721.1 (2Fe-2S)-binding protein [Verticiella sp. GG226]